jgi:hypothetical protein
VDYTSSLCLCNRLSKKIAFTICCMSILTMAREGDEGVQVKEGNLAVAGTMQPGPFLGFGQNILNEHEGLAVLFPSWLVGKNKNWNELLPYVVFEFSEHWSVLLGLPTAIKYKQDGHHSSGSEDLFVQFEYAFYARHQKKATNQFTLVTALYLPTGNELKIPSTGYGSPSIFLGITAERLAVDWYLYTSYGVLFTTTHDCDTKAGNQFFYQAGVARNIAYRTEKWILMWMVEVFGWYEQKWKTDGIIDDNSGFNLILLGPSLWFSTEQFFLQAGIAPAVYQRVNGDEPKNSFFAAMGFGWRFH